MVEPEALLPALMMMSNPFQSATSLNSKQAEAQTSDFKARLLQIYFSTPAPPGLQLPQPQAHQKKCHCMVSRLRLKSKLIEAAHIWPKASAQWGTCALGVTDVWDVRSGLLWAEPFEKAYHSNEIVVMYWPSTGTFRFRVLIENLMCKRLSEYGRSPQARDCPDLQKQTFGEYDDTDLLMPSGNMPFRRNLAMHAAMAVAAQRLQIRSSVSFRAEDFDFVGDHAGKGTTAAWVQRSLATTFGRDDVEMDVDPLQMARPESSDAVVDARGGHESSSTDEHSRTVHICLMMSRVSSAASTFSEWMQSSMKL